MNRAGWAGLVGAAVGVAAAGATVAVRVARGRGSGEPDPGDRLGGLAPTRESTVTTADGLALSVEEVDPDDGGEPALTAVLVHGFAMSRLCWHFQRRDLAALTDPRVRQVLYDHRSHGRSARARADTSTIDQLAADLDEVIRAVAPTGPLVLVGHSMGGMAIMALAERDPGLFADRVRGVAFIGTSAGEVGKSGLPRPLLSKYNPTVRLLGVVADRQPRLVELVRSAGGRLTRRGTRVLGFGSGDVSPAAVDFLVSMLDATPVRVLADFADTLGSHNRYAALAGLKHCRVLVLGGDEDRMTPFSHSERIALALPDATLVKAPGAGHTVMLEQPDLVTGHLTTLLRECARGRGADSEGAAPTRK
ncbi:alpha/beta fold hydrolase [Actinokineospora spheciospongiae]|uniref:alpha/beta fold hydrolase n=1 Tax=Actinokineospora spheciospongiae TaxID=909613 RepID=UPI000DA01EDA|nr:alpha/beta hydrolase [Actinokineospora spheciospongiae]PWW64360.1 pimeloyl-ACP methyl ester carboxylesterase [Actinokineospora spheciospongiae]